MIVLNENIKGLKVGTKMIGNWGAMIPLSYGTVTDVIRDYKGVDVEVTEWDDLRMGRLVFTQKRITYKGELIIMIITGYKNILSIDEGFGLFFHLLLIMLQKVIL